MEMKEYVPLFQLCESYSIEDRFFDELQRAGLVEIIIVEEESCLHIDMIDRLEKMIRLHQELKVNIEGIDVVMNLLQKVDRLQHELNSTKNRLSIYEF